jgi:hypothetical protein
MKFIELSLPAPNPDAVDNIIDSGDEYIEMLYHIASDYADDIMVNDELGEAAMDLFCKLIDAGFYHIETMDEGDQARMVIRVWSPSEQRYKFMNDFNMVELCIADSFQRYFTGVN